MHKGSKHIEKANKKEHTKDIEQDSVTRYNVDESVECKVTDENVVPFTIVQVQIKCS